MIAARIIADSIYGPHRLTTVEAHLPRFLLAELNTHRTFSRNSASSRAIPVRRRIRDVLSGPFVPDAFGANKAGMQAGGTVGGWRSVAARAVWMASLYAAVTGAYLLSALNVHKQWANRLLEPFAYTTVIVSATEWENFFAQRLHADAQPEMQQVAWAIFDAMAASTPRICAKGDMHLPYLQPDEAHLSKDRAAQVCIARCARVSYLTQNGKRDIDEDVLMYWRLRKPGHMSPFEHVAIAGTGSGNFRGWAQARSAIPNEANFLGDKPTNDRSK